MSDPAEEANAAHDVIDHTCGLLPVRDQGRRGTCLAFAATAAHEHSRLRRRGTLTPELSVELLFWHCKQLDGVPGQDGTRFTTARDALVDPGQCRESLWPYNDARSQSNQYTPPAAAISPQALRRATMSAIDPSAGSVSGVLHGGGLVLAGIELWNAFYECRVAQLRSPAGDKDGARHAVCLVGVDECENTIKLRNSWGTNWGDRGYAWVDRGALAGVMIEAWEITDDIDSA
jgi:C1A family cysteine protease